MSAYRHGLPGGVHIEFPADYHRSCCNPATRQLQPLLLPRHLLQQTAGATPKPTFTPSAGTVVAFTAASLSGVSPTLAADFAKAYPGENVVFNLDGTQALKTQVENGAYADVFISASNSYTKELTTEGYFVNGTVKPLTSNYLIVILPAANTANITSLADLANPGVKIAMEDKSVPAGRQPSLSLPTSPTPPTARTGIIPCTTTW